MKENFEQPRNTNTESILDSIENQLVLTRKLGDVYDNRPDLNSFVGAMKGTKYEEKYTEESIRMDEEYVENTRKKIDESNSSGGRQNLDNKEIGFQLSEMMQAMIVDRLNNHWFKNFQAVMTSDFDDLKVGIDAVLKHEKGTYLGAAFDFTVTNQDTIIYKKLKKEWEDHVVKGSIPTVKYFEDPDTKEKKSLLVPKFIIGASKKDVEDMAQAYIVNDVEVLENHPLKYVILQQIEEQLQTVLDYHETNPDNEKLAFARRQYEAIQKLLRIMKNDIHIDENMNVDLHEYSKENKALDMMRRFRIMRQRKEEMPDEIDTNKE